MSDSRTPWIDVPLFYVRIVREAATGFRKGWETTLFWLAIATLFVQWLAPAWLKVVQDKIALPAWVLPMAATVFIAARLLWVNYTKHAELETAAGIRSKMQKLADALWERRAYCIQELMKLPATTDAELEALRAAEIAWRDSIVEILRAHDCPAQDIEPIRLLGTYSSMADTPEQQITDRVAERLKRLEATAHKYSPD